MQREVTPPDSGSFSSGPSVLLTQRVEPSLAAPCPTSLSEMHNCDIALHNLSRYIEIGAVLVQLILLGV